MILAVYGSARQNVTTRAAADDRLLTAADRAELLGKGHFHCCDAPV